MTNASIVVMGVSGCGKSSLASALAARLNCPFIEGDDLHPPANIDKMRAGIPLDDTDRAPFLDAVGAALAAGTPSVASCSALKRAYRDRLRAHAGNLIFVLPEVSADALAWRMRNRPGHFMPPSLLESQLAALERPGRDERHVIVSGADDIERQCASVLLSLKGI